MLIRILATLGVGVWCFFVLFAALGLVIDRGLADSPWAWLGVLSLGVVAPVVMLTLVNRAISQHEDRKPPLPDARDQETELLKVFEERAEVTPTVVAMKTTLTIEEAARMLENLSVKGHLRAVGGHGTLAYALPDDGHAVAPEVEEAGETTAIEAENGTSPSSEPLSEREKEVLQLLSSGRTNREIADDLFLALGTVKAHTNNIYRKLGARNRAEAISHARKHGVL